LARWAEPLDAGTHPCFLINAQKSNSKVALPYSNMKEENFVSCPDIKDCYFYHTMDIPGHGTVDGQWDMRGKENEYLGDVKFWGRSVLEIGTASGFLCFAMEKLGARVTAYDLSDQHDWDIVPYGGQDYKKELVDRRKHLREINNGFWFAHNKLRSKANMVYGTVYTIPEDIGRFEIGVVGMILLHLRDPFLALQKISEHIDESIIVTGFLPDNEYKNYLLNSPFIRFLPDPVRQEPNETWWDIGPGLIENFLKVLGFEYVNVQWHKQSHHGKVNDCYTIVGHRTKMAAERNGGQVQREAPASIQQHLSFEEAAMNKLKYSDIVRYLVRRGMDRLVGRQK
jgi:hypothetical protein